MTDDNFRADSAKKPYGNVTYADPKNGKYPIDTEAHAKAAWSYINMPKNAAQYPMNGVTLSEVKARIRAACKKFGISISDQSNSQQLAPDIDVIRALTMGPVLRSEQAGGDSLGRLVVPFSPFNVWYEVNSKWEGRFMERTTPGTFADTVAADRATMRSLFDHGHDPQIGNKVLGPIADLREDTTGPVGEVDLLDTSYNRDLLPGLRRGVYGSSFRMHVLADTWDDKPSKSAHNPDGLPERTITKTKTLEFGPVTFPANPAATATVRSMTDYFYDQLRLRDTSAYEAAARAAGFPDLTGRPDARSAGGGDESGERPGTGPTPTLTYRQRLDDGALRARGILK
jgi:HK97 family phage prohead protease